MELFIAKFPQDSSGGNLDRVLDGPLIFWLLDPSGKDHCSVVGGQLLVGTINTWFVELRLCNARLQVVRDDGLGDSTKVGEGLYMPLDPAGELLIPEGIRIDELTAGEDGNKETGFS